MDSQSAISAEKLGVEAFFHGPTVTFCYLVWCRETRHAAVIDSVLDYDQKSGRTTTKFIDGVIAKANDEKLTIDWILETHAHADHISAAPVVRNMLGGRTAIGAKIAVVQKVFKDIFDAGDVVADGSAFDRLIREGDRLRLGALEIEVMETPGHTPACVSYRIGDAVFVGDTLFMPDYGTARCDFPGGDAATLYRSIRRILSLAPETRLFMCHDYLPAGRTEYECLSTVAEQRARNIHIHDGVSEVEFVSLRQARDRTLPVPVLILPSIQVNIRAGNFPPPAANGTVYLKIPINRL